MVPPGSTENSRLTAFTFAIAGKPASTKNTSEILVLVISHASGVEGCRMRLSSHSVVHDPAVEPLRNVPVIAHPTRKIP